MILEALKTKELLYHRRPGVADPRSDIQNVLRETSISHAPLHELSGNSGKIEGSVASWVVSRSFRS